MYASSASLRRSWPDTVGSVGQNMAAEAIISHLRLVLQKLDASSTVSG